MTKEPTVLAIETAINTGSVAILKGKNLNTFLIGNREISRSEDLLQMISDVLETGNLQLRDIDLISVSTGPGSFTGIRVGLVTAKALAFGLNCPWIGVSALESLICCLEDMRDYKMILTIIFSGADRVYWQYFPASKNEENLHNYTQPHTTSREKFSMEFKNIYKEKTFVVLTGASVEEFLALGIKLKDKDNVYNASDNVAEYVGFNGQIVLDTDNKNKAPFKSPVLYIQKENDMPFEQSN